MLSFFAIVGACASVYLAFRVGAAVVHLCVRVFRKTELRITDAGRAYVQTPEFADSVANFYLESNQPVEVATEDVCRMICLGMCEVDPEHGPEVDSPEFERFVIQNKAEIEEIGQSVVGMLWATQLTQSLN